MKEADVNIRINENTVKTVLCKLQGEESGKSISIRLIISFTYILVIMFFNDIYCNYNQTGKRCA